MKAIPSAGLLLAALVAAAAEPAAPRFDPIPERFDRPASERFAPRHEAIPSRFDRPAKERIARPVAPKYEPELGEGTLPVVLALWPGMQFGYEQDDVSILRFGLIGSRNHNVSFLDFNLFYGRTTGAESALQLGAANVVEGPLTGVQLGLVNISGVLEESRSAGAQIGLLGSYSDTLAGVQLGGLFNRAATGTGLQLAALCNYSDDFRGIQLGAINLEGDDLRAIQLGIVNGGATAYRGVQLGLVNSSQGDFHGLQLGVANTVQTLGGGLQLGLVNFAGEMHGWQIGVYNTARAAHGVQIGLLNVDDSAEWPFLPLLRASF